MGAITPAAALEALRALGDPARAAAAAAYHATARPCLGVPVPQITELTRSWRAGMDIADRVALAAALWDADFHESRIAAAKLFVQARIRPDAAVWAEIRRWVPMLDGWALTDHAAEAGSRRLAADPARLDDLEAWARDPSPWVRRAAFMFTLPWARQRHPRPDDRDRSERVLGWAAAAARDRDRFVQKAIATWLRTLARHDAARARDFLDGPGMALKPFARREAARGLRPAPGPGQRGR